MFNKIISIVITISLICTFELSNAFCNVVATQIINKDIFNLPTSIGVVTKSKNFGSDDIVINIQDLHCHPQTQKSIAQIIEYIETFCNIDSVFVEGASRDIDTTWLSNIRKNKIGIEFVDSLVENGKIGGAEYYSAIKNKKHFIKGIENKQLYDENIKLLNIILNSSKEIENIYSKMEKELQNIKNEYFNKRSKKLDSITNKYYNKEIEPIQYFSKVKNVIPTDTIKQNDNYSTLDLYIKVLKLKSTLNYNRVTSELKLFISNLKENISYIQYSTLLKDSNNLKNLDNIVDDLIKYKEIYSKNKYPELDKFFNLLKQRQSLNPLLFIEQEQEFIEDMFNSFAENKYEKDIVFVLEFLPLIKNFFTAKITPNEYIKFIKNFNKFKKIWNNYSTSNIVTELDKFVAIVSQYHVNNLKRDDVFTEKLIGENNKNTQNIEIDRNIKNDISNKNIKVVITGGFHSQGLEAIFDRSKVSYMVITPKIVDDTYDDNKQYLSIIKQYSAILENTINVPTITETLLLETIIPEILSILLKVGLQYSDQEVSQLVNDIFTERLKQQLYKNEIKNIQFNIEYKNNRKQYQFTYINSKDIQKEVIFNDKGENITPSNKATIVRNEKSILNKLGFIWEEMVFRIAPVIISSIAGLTLTNPITLTATLISGIILFPLAHYAYDSSKNIQNKRFGNLLIPSTILTVTYLVVSSVNPMFGAAISIGLHFIYNYLVEKNISKKLAKIIEPIVAGLPQKSTYIKKYLKIEDVDFGKLANSGINSVIVMGKPVFENEDSVISISYPLENERSKSIKIYMQVVGSNTMFFVDCNLSEFNEVVNLFIQRVNSDYVVKAKVFSFMYPSLFSKLGEITGLKKGNLANIGSKIYQTVQTGFEMPLKLPNIFKLDNISIKYIDDNNNNNLTSQQKEIKNKIAKQYPNTRAKVKTVQLVSGQQSQLQNEIKTVAFVLSGGSASGGHNVISGLYRSLKESNPNIRVLGFIQGPGGILKNDVMEITDDVIEEYINTGGFNMTITDRTKLTPDKFARVKEVFEENEIDSFVVIGGDDSNTNAADLAEFFAGENAKNPNSRKVSVIGVPKTIDGDLKNEYIETSFGFDTATKAYSQFISNFTRDQLSTAKMWTFVSLMGRKASHVTLEVALRINPDIVLIGEKIQQEQMSLDQVIDMIVNKIVEKSNEGKNYGTVLIPEGLIEFIPEINNLLEDLKNIFTKYEQKLENISKQEKIEFIMEELRLNHQNSYKLINKMPVGVQNQLLTMELDPHGNIPVSDISTGEFVNDMVTAKLNELKKQGTYKGKFSAKTPFYGYEGRATEPSEFDKTYTYALGYTAGNLIVNGVNGAMAVVQDLEKPVEQWRCGGCPLVDMMTIEQRHGKDVPVIEKALLKPETDIFKLLEFVTNIRSGFYRIVKAPQQGMESFSLPITLMFEKLSPKTVQTLLNIFNSRDITTLQKYQQIFEILSVISNGVDSLDQYLQSNDLLEYKNDILKLVEYLNSDKFEDNLNFNLDMLNALNIPLTDINILKILKLVDDFGKNNVIQNKALNLMENIKDISIDELPAINELINIDKKIDIDKIREMLSAA